MPLLWPRLRVVSCWDQGRARAEADTIRRWFPRARVQGKGLLATEGVVSVPDPGRVIVETYPREQMVTTFTVDPEGDGARLTIATSIPARTPFTAGLEERVLRRLLEPIYAEEFALIAKWALYWYE